MLSRLRFVLILWHGIKKTVTADTRSVLGQCFDSSNIMVLSDFGNVNCVAVNGCESACADPHS